jgi:transcriptional regulator with XRE-family HTH domain
VPEAAKLLRVSERTVQYWESGRVRVPYSAYKLMRLLRGYELPGAAWRGYRLTGDTLWSPEGLAFKAADHRWWSLTCRMADQFRAMASARRSAPGFSGLVLSSTSENEIHRTAEIPGFLARPSAGCEGQGQGPVLQQVIPVPLGVAA